MKDIYKYVIIDWVVYEKLDDDFQEIAKTSYQYMTAKRDTSLWEVDPKWYTIKGSVA